MHRYLRFWTGLLGMCSGMVLLAGCGAGSVPKAKVKGTATLDDHPIKFGIISFQPTEVTGSPAQGYIKDGQYTINEINFGKYQVNLTAEADAPAEMPNQGAAGEASSDMMRSMQKGKSPTEIGAKMAKGRRPQGNDPNAMENAIRRSKGMADNIMPPNAEGNNKQIEVIEKDQVIDFNLSTPGKKK